MSMASRLNTDNSNNMFVDDILDGWLSVTNMGDFLVTPQAQPMIDTPQQYSASLAPLDAVSDSVQPQLEARTNGQSQMWAILSYLTTSPTLSH